MEPIINSQMPEFKVQAFQNGSFKTVSSEDVKGKWAIFFFYPADFTFVCPTELVDVAEKYEPTHTSYTKHGTMLRKASVRSNIRCWQTRQVY